MSEIEVQSRITECLARAVKGYCDEKKPSIARDILKSYLFTLCKQRMLFLQAAIANLRAANMEPPTSFRVADLIVHLPARWEFEHVDVFGTVSDALCCATRYRVCSKFIGVHPLTEDDPFFSPAVLSRIPMRHKPSSPWHRAFMRRHRLKHQLGRRWRALVSYARSMTKAEFLEQFSAKPNTTIAMTDKNGRPYNLRRMIPDIPVSVLLDRTGYTPEEFWREVKRPNTITPRRPQLELFPTNPSVGCKIQDHNPSSTYRYSGRGFPKGSVVNHLLFASSSSSGDRWLAFRERSNASSNCFLASSLRGRIFPIGLYLGTNGFVINSVVTPKL